MNKLFLFFLVFVFLNACQAAKDGLTQQKRSNADEFLVEKKNPLVLPPEFSELPQPKSSSSLNENEEVSFETKILSKDNNSSFFIDYFKNYQNFLQKNSLNSFINNILDFKY